MKQLLVFLLLLCAASASAQDVIVKKDGSTVVCRVVELTATEITYKKWGNLNGSNYVMERSTASAINYENGKKVNLSELENLYQPGNQNDGVQQYNDRALLAMDAQSHPKRRRTFKWNVRAGYSLDLWNGLSAASGFDASLGISKSFGRNDMFWGIDAGAMTYSSKYKKDDYMDRDLKISPIVLSLNPYVGINIPLSQDIYIAPYIGPYAGYILSADDYYNYSSYGNEERLSVDREIYANNDDHLTIGVNIGMELYLSRTFFIDLHLKKSISNDARLSSYNRDFLNDSRSELHKKYSALKIVLGVGLQF